MAGKFVIRISPQRDKSEAGDYEIHPGKHPIGYLLLRFYTGSWALDDQDDTSVTCDNFNIHGNPYFGDTHVHTTFSVDAFPQGVNTTPEQAYRFAKGEQIGLHPFDANGLPTRFAQLERPLDFAVVTDHAEFFGEYNICLDPSNPLYYEPKCEIAAQAQWNSDWVERAVGCNDSPT